MNNHNSLFSSALPQFFFSLADDGAGSGSGNVNNDDNEGGGNDDDANNGDAKSKPNDSNNSQARKVEIQQAVQSALNDHVKNNNGDKDATLFDLTKKLHGVEKQRDDARANSLSKADREAFTAFKALNLSTDDIKTMAGEYGTMKEQQSRESKVKSQKEAAELLPDVDAVLLARTEGSKDVDYEITGEGDKRAPVVKFKNSEGVEVVKPMGEWLRETYPDLSGKLYDVDNRGQARKITPYGKSAPANGGEKISLKEQILAEEKAGAKNGNRRQLSDEVDSGKAPSLDERLGRVRRN